MVYRGAAGEEYSESYPVVSCIRTCLYLRDFFGETIRISTEIFILVRSLCTYSCHKVITPFYNYRMEKTARENKKLLKELNVELKRRQAELLMINKFEGKDAYIDVKISKNQARFEKNRKNDSTDTAVGKFFMELAITAKQAEVFIPISIASGKKTAGFMYQIEGTAEGQIATTGSKVRGERISQVTLGTLLYAKIPTGKTASFQIQATIRGGLGKRYKIVFTRLNYKLHLTDARYQQYLKEIHSDSVTFS